MLKALVSGVAAIGVSCGAAQATPFDWSGIYFGVHGGMASGDATGSAGIQGDWILCYYVDCDEGYYQASADDTYRVQGAFGGAQIGADFANNAFLVGVVGDFAWSGMSGDGALADITLFGDHGLAAATVGTDVKWTSTVRARAGVIGNQNTLAYITGGLAIASVDSSLGYELLGHADSTTHNTTRYGWTIGAGLEHPLNDNVTIGSSIYTRTSVPGTSSTNRETSGSVALPAGSAASARGPIMISRPKTA